LCRFLECGLGASSALLAGFEMESPASPDVSVPATYESDAFCAISEQSCMQQLKHSGI